MPANKYLTKCYSLVRQNMVAQWTNILVRCQTTNRCADAATSSWIQCCELFFPLSRRPEKPSGGNSRKMGKDCKFLPPSVKNGENCPSKGSKMLRKCIFMFFLFSPPCFFRKNFLYSFPMFPPRRLPGPSIRVRGKTTRKSNVCC